MLLTGGYNFAGPNRRVSNRPPRLSAGSAKRLKTKERRCSAGSDFGRSKYLHRSAKKPKTGTVAHPPVNSAPFSGTCYDLSPACYANLRK